MPIYSVQGPDGRIYDVEGPAGTSEEDILAFVQQNLGALQEQKPKEGILAALGKGAESYASQARTALQGPSAESAEAGIARGKDISTRYANQADPDKVIEAYQKDGALSALGTAVPMVPYAIAEQAPNIAGMVAGAQAGQKLGSVFGGVGRLGGAGLGALAGRFAASYLPLAGGDIEAQAEAQKERGEPINISGAKAYGTAVLQAGIDTATMGFIAGGRGLMAKLLGKTETSLAGKSAAEVEKLAQETLLPLLAKGTAKGAIAEIPGEITQDILTRAQAGQDLTSPEALASYGKTAISVGLLAPLGAAGRYSERGGAKAEVEAKAELAKRKERIEALGREEEAAKAKEAADLAEAARRQTPAFALEAEQT